MNNTYADAICDQLTIHADLSATKKKEEENAKKITAPCRGKELCSSATGIRTPVYGVRGRCPRPLDDSTIESIKQRRK